MSLRRSSEAEEDLYRTGTQVAFNDWGGGAQHTFVIFTRDSPPHFFCFTWISGLICERDTADLC